MDRKAIQSGFRQSTGKNFWNWKEMPEELKPKKKLNEHLGHTLPQVLMGALLGTAIGITGPMIW